MSNEEFEDVVRKTIASLPDEFLTQLDNVEIIIEDEPPPNLPLLGLYRGVPKTKRMSYSALPDKISIYKKPLLGISNSDTEARENIRITVLHEIGHHFGLTDEELRRINK